jgi:hypothetical protein
MGVAEEAFGAGRGNREREIAANDAAADKELNLVVLHLVRF